MRALVTTELTDGRTGGRARVRAAAREAPCRPTRLIMSAPGSAAGRGGPSMDAGAHRAGSLRFSLRPTDVRTAVPGRSLRVDVYEYS